MTKKILPCPFCGEIPDGIEKDYVPASLSIGCKNKDCYIQPSIHVSVSCQMNPGGCTFTPLFEKHENEIIEKWNIRASQLPQEDCQLGKNSK